MTPDNLASSHNTYIEHRVCECRQPGQTGAGGMTKAELQVSFVLLLPQCDQDVSAVSQHAYQGLWLSQSTALLQARLEVSERSGAKDSEEDFAGMLPLSP